MYRIQAFNTKTQAWEIHYCKTMEEREEYIKERVNSGEVKPPSISWEWLARS